MQMIQRLPKDGMSIDEMTDGHVQNAGQLIRVLQAFKLVGSLKEISWSSNASHSYYQWNWRGRIR
jgi:hypothetical protein